MTVCPIAVLAAPSVCLIVQKCVTYKRDAEMSGGFSEKSFKKPLLVRVLGSMPFTLAISMPYFFDYN